MFNPKVMYAAQSWRPILKCDIAAVEIVQRPYIKQLPGIGHLSYEQRLLSLQTLSLKDSRQDLTLLFKCVYDINGLGLQDFGLALSDNNERSGKLRINRPALSIQQASALFKCRAGREWNQLPASLNYDVKLQTIHI